MGFGKPRDWGPRGLFANMINSIKIFRIEDKLPKKNLNLNLRDEVPVREFADVIGFSGWCFLLPAKKYWDVSFP